MKKLKKTLDFKLKLPKTRISKVLDNPKEWAEQTVEEYFKKESFRIIEAKGLGENFAKKLKEQDD